MFQQPIDRNDRTAMTEFLKNHFRYHTMNVWNQSTSYANNVKLYNLDIPQEHMEKAFDLLCGDVDTTYYNDLVNQIIEEFNAKTGYTIGFNGRSSGYLVLYDTGYDRNKNCNVVYPGRSIDMHEDFDPGEWDMNRLRERVELVCQFDECCDQIRKEFLYVLEYCDIEEKEILRPVTTKTLRPKK